MEQQKSNIESLVISLLGTRKINSSKTEILDDVRNILEQFSKNKHEQYGFRTENMFSYVASALGGCSLVKQEDGSGACFSSEKNLKIPDYKLILKKGELFFVEVKNCANSKKISFKEDYIKGLEKYAKLNGSNLKIAIYWSSFKIWSLVDSKKLVFNKKKCVLDITKAFTINEMAILEDKMIGAKPFFKMNLIFNKSKIHKINNNGKFENTISSVEIYNGGSLILKETEKNIAFQLILFISGNSKWKETEKVIMKRNVPFGVEYSFSPLSRDNPKQLFEIIGNLSSLISRKYNTSTTYGGDISQIYPNQEPKNFEIFIPEDYKGEVLSLWQFTLNPK